VIEFIVCPLVGPSIVRRSVCCGAQGWRLFESLPSVGNPAEGQQHNMNTYNNIICSCTATRQSHKHTQGLSHRVSSGTNTRSSASGRRTLGPVAVAITPPGWLVATGSMVNVVIGWYKTNACRARNEKIGPNDSAASGSSALCESNPACSRPWLSWLATVKQGPCEPLVCTCISRRLYPRMDFADAVNIGKKT
jgi:hypothetical protein